MDDHRKRSKASLGAVLILAMCLVFGLGPVVAAQDADFGDLPDPGFPTLRNSQSSPGFTGPYHLDVSHEWIGSSSTPNTTVELDAKLVNRDEDDGYVTIQPLVANGARIGLAEVTIPITTDADKTVRYLNVAADLNEDGRFCAYYVGGDRTVVQREWIVQNLPIVFVGRTEIVATRFELLDPFVLYEHPATRATLTTAPIRSALYGGVGWDGSGPLGGFARGETEDYLPGEGIVSPLLFDPEVTLVLKDQPAPQPKPVTPPTPPTPPSVDLDRTVPVLPEVCLAGVKRWAQNGCTTDIVQGKNECVPTSVTDSVRFLLDKTGTAQKMSAALGYTSDELDDWLLVNLAREMETDPATGTSLAGLFQGEEWLNRYLEQGFGEGVTTSSVIENPDFQALYEALRLGKDVKLSFRWERAGQIGYHMVTVVGVAEKCDGTKTISFLDHGPRPYWDGESWIAADAEHSVRVPPVVTTLPLTSDGRILGYADETTVLRMLIEVSLDYGDAPAPYPTLLTDDGARHIIDGVHFLGADVDGDRDGYPDDFCFGDDLRDGRDDEDGVWFLTPLVPGNAAQVAVVASTTGYLDAWVDFNDDGDWADPWEQVFTSRLLNPGDNLLSFAVPIEAWACTHYARFRFSSVGGLSYTGEAPDGEVEDYIVEHEILWSWQDCLERLAEQTLARLTSEGRIADVKAEFQNRQLELLLQELESYRRAELADRQSCANDLLQAIRLTGCAWWRNVYGLDFWYYLFGE